MVEIVQEVSHFCNEVALVPLAVGAMPGVSHLHNEVVLASLAWARSAFVAQALPFSGWVILFYLFTYLFFLGIIKLNYNLIQLG